MKRIAPVLVVTLATCMPMLVYAGSGIDLKQIVKDSMKNKGQSNDAQAAPDSPASGSTSDHSSVGAMLPEVMPDIAGIKLRMPLAQQKALVAKINPQYKVVDVKDARGNVAGIEGVAYDSDNRPQDQFIALQDEEGKVWFLGRVQKYGRGNYIPKDTFVTALNGKYGVPTEVTPNNEIFNWIYDRNNALKDRRENRVCPGYAAGEVSGPLAQEVSKLANSWGISLKVPASFRPTCGIQINGNLFTTVDDRNMITGSSVQIVDYKSRFDVINKARATQDAARQKERDAMKDNKPKL